MSRLAESVALELLKQDGIGVVWQAHLAASTARRLGNRVAAERLLEIAEAAEGICLRDVAVNQGILSCSR
jgi:hypothetical protein